ncbi:MAG TPA: 50S ribosomal protein L13 [Patescibacteria group bacterium]|nr:50S ribosomal protein L13 [Patescibacteria group bacterium]
MTKTYQPSAKDIKRSWHLIDAKDKILGRVASDVAELLMGKGKTSFSRHLDSGDNVVVINAEKIVITGNKAKQKVYITHSGYPGGFKSKKYAKVLEIHPERILEHAIKGMLPDNKLQAPRMARLNVIVGEEHKFNDKFTNEN